MCIPRHERELTESINNLGVVTSDQDVNDLAARHCEDKQVWNTTTNIYIIMLFVLL